MSLNGEAVQLLEYMAKSQIEGYRGTKYEYSEEQVEIVRKLLQQLRMWAADLTGPHT